MQRGKPEYSWDVFVSYSHKDADIVRPLVKELQEALADERIIFYLDAADEPHKHQHGLETGISEGLASCQIMLVFLSDNYFKSPWCKTEVKTFFLKKAHELESFPDYLPDTPVSPLPLEQTIFPVAIGISDPRESVLILSKFHLFFNMDNLDNLIKNKLPFSRIFWSHPEEGALLLTLASQLKKSFDHIRKYHESLRETGLFPYLNTPKKVWDTFWSEYPYTQVGPKIDIENILAGFKPDVDFSGFHFSIDRYSENSLLSLYKAIAVNAPISYSLNMRMVEGMRTSGIPCEIFKNGPELTRLTQIGPPVPVFIGNVRIRCLTTELQCSYYRYLQLEGRHILVDTAVMAGLLMSLDIWQILVTTEQDFIEYVVEPLATGGNISQIY